MELDEGHVEPRALVLAVLSPVSRLLQGGCYSGFGIFRART